MKVISVVGARPQFVKVAPISRAFDGLAAHEHFIVHTGQHYDYEMSKLFFDTLDIREPRYNLGVGSGNHGRQTGLMLEDLEKVFRDEKPDFVLTYGDTNSTLAAALAVMELRWGEQ